MSRARGVDLEKVPASVHLPRPSGDDRELVARLERLGVRQLGDPVLQQVARPYALPADHGAAREDWQRLVATAARIRRLHEFSAGMGLAAPQLGIGRRLVLVAPAGRRAFPLVNPTIVETSPDLALDYEGCLSFFHVRGQVPRPTWVTVRSQRFTGEVVVTRFDASVGRLVCHEVDHLDGRLYLDRLAPDAELVNMTAYHRQRRVGAPVAA